MTEEQKKEVTAYQTQQLKQAILHAQKQSMRFADFRRNYGKL